MLIPAAKLAWAIILKVCKKVYTIEKSSSHAGNKTQAIKPGILTTRPHGSYNLTGLTITICTYFMTINLAIAGIILWNWDTVR